MCGWVGVIFLISFSSLLADCWTDWKFQTTRLEGIGDGRMAKPGDVCYYPAWTVHAQPIIDAMKLFVAAKKNPKKAFKRAKSAGRTTATSKYEYLWETANKLSEARMVGARNIQTQLQTGSVTEPYDISDTGLNASKLVRLLCEGGQLLSCKQNNDLEVGFCHCFDLPEGSPLYNRKEEDGICKAPVGASCDPTDPVITTHCMDILQCQNYSKAACAYAFGPKFHCDGNGQGYIGTKNFYCYRAGRPPENDNDLISSNSSSALIVLESSWIWIIVYLRLSAVQLRK